MTILKLLLGGAVAIAGAAHPGDGIEQRNENEHSEHHDGESPASPEFDGALAPEAIAGKPPCKPDAAGNQEDDPNDSQRRSPTRQREHD